METILHIGLPKTGTTILQKTLRRSRTYLAERGVVYPKNPPPCKFASHKILASIVISERKHGRDVRSIAPDAEQLASLQEAFLVSIVAECEKRDPQSLVLSAEHLSSPNIQPAKLKDALARLNAGKAHCVVYCRRPSEHFLSSAQQRIKASYLLPFYRRQLVGVLDIYREILGNDAVHARLYDRRELIDGDIVADFCGHFLASRDIRVEELTRGKSDNATMSAESMAILIDFRKTFYPDANDRKTKDTQALLRVLAEADVAIGTRRPSLRPEVAEAIDYCDPAPLVLRDRYGVIFPDFDYARLERGDLTAPPPSGASLESLVQWDDERKGQLMPKVASSQWAQEDEDRLRWITRLTDAAA